MSKSNLVSEWLQIASDDFNAAKFLYNQMHPKPLEIICYHCQQCAEKALKGYLCANGIDVPKTHEVGLLCHRCAEIESSFSKFFEDCEELEIYATATRYPNRIELIESNAEHALEQTQEILNFVLQHISGFKKAIDEHDMQM